MDCHDLDATPHEILYRCCMRGFNARSRLAKTTIGNLSQDLGLKWIDVRTHIQEDLDKFLSLDDRDGIVIHETCDCRPSHTERLESATSRVRPRAHGDFYSPSSFRLPPEARETTEVGRDHRGANDHQTTPDESTASRRAKIPPPKPPEEMHALDLAYHFRETMERARSVENWGTIGATNVMALARQFRRWMREDGVTSAGIYFMIEAFALDPRWLRLGDTAWRTFLNNRAALAKRTSNLMEAHSNRELGWVASADLDLAEDDDEAGGLGWS